MKKRLIYFVMILPLFFIAQNKEPQYYLPDSLNSYVYRILYKVKANEQINHPDNLNSYKYYLYNKFYIDDYNYINWLNADSVETSNSNQKELIFLGERLVECKYDNKLGRKNIIIADQISGFKEPFYELFSEPAFQEDFPDVLKKNIDSYNFRLVDSVYIEKKKNYVISFGSKKNLLVNGSRGALYIDAQSFAVIKYSGEEYNSGYTRFFEYQWKPFQNIWYLENKTNKIRISTIDVTRFFSKKYQKQKYILTPWIVIQSDIRDFNSPESFSGKDFNGYTYELDENFRINSEARIASYRSYPLNSREKNIYNYSSLFETFPIEKNVRMLNSLKKGKFPLGKVDLNLLNSTSFNDYEGFRFQLGGKTNYKFNENMSLLGYIAFGTKDTNLKGALGIDFSIHKKNNGKLSLLGFSDVNPFSRNIERNPKTFSQVKEELNYIQNSIFYSYRGGKISYEQDFFENLTTSFGVSYETQKSNYDYSYLTNSFTHSYNHFSTSVHIKYAPFGKYMQTPQGKITIEDKPIYFYFDYLKGWKGFYGDFDYHKFDFTSDISIKNFLGNSSIVVNSGYISGKTALWNMYGSFGNAKSGHSVWNRFSAKGFHSFETLLPGDFFADKYAAFFFTHTLNDIRFWGNKKLQLSLVYNGMIGNMENKNSHTISNFTVPKKYYQEVGVELNRFIYYFGIGVYYRIGAYHKPAFDDNLFIKLTFNFF